MPGHWLTAFDSQPGAEEGPRLCPLLRRTHLVLFRLRNFYLRAPKRWPATTTSVLVLCEDSAMQPDKCRRVSLGWFACAAVLAATLATTARPVDGTITHMSAPIMGFSTWNQFACNIHEVSAYACISMQPGTHSLITRHRPHMFTHVHTEVQLHATSVRSVLLHA